MWKILIFVCALLGSHYVHGLDSVSHFQFAADFIPILAERHSQENVVISPISVQAILTLAAVGSKGETWDELQKVTHLESYENKDAVCAGYKEFLGTLTNARPQRITMANRIYVGKNYSLKPSFNELAINSFGSKAESIDFGANIEAAATINKWVSDETKNKIKQIIEPSTINAATVAVLVNAVHFKSPWQKQFIEDETSEEDFHLTTNQKTKVEMMYHDYITTLYCESNDLDVKAVQLPFRDTDLKMVIMLPNKIDGLLALQKKLKLADIQKLNDSCSMQSVALQLPKFTVDFGTSLQDVMEKLGMEKSFVSVDFSDMLEPNHPPLAISDVIHKAFITVNEAGAEAGASTAVPIYARMGRRRGLYEVNVNHPFAFTIQDNNAIYFMGHVYHPTTEH